MAANVSATGNGEAGDGDGAVAGAGAGDDARDVGDVVVHVCGVDKCANPNANNIH